MKITALSYTLCLIIQIVPDGAKGQPTSTQVSSSATDQQGNTEAHSTTSEPTSVPETFPEPSSEPEPENQTSPEPESVTSEPDQVTSEPESTSEPEAVTSEPEPSTSEPVSSSTSEPEPSTSEPEPSTSEPEHFTSEQEASASEPVTPESEPVTAEPVSSTSEPEPATSEPEPSTSEPEYVTVEPEPSTSEPELSTSEPEPSTSEPEPATSEPEPSTSEPEPSTSEPEPVTAEPESSSSSSEPEPSTAEPEPSTSEPEPSTAEPEPSTSEPEHSPSEPGYTSEPEQTNGTNVSSEPMSESEPGVEPEAWPEPGPDWSVAYAVWGPAWPSHVYVFGMLFLLLSTTTSVFITVICYESKAALRGKLTISLLCMEFFFSLLRSVSLLGDPYLTTGSVSWIVSRLIWSLAQPAITSAFSLILLVLLDTTRMSIGPPRFQNLRMILAVTFGHFLLVGVSDVVVFHQPSAKVMLMVCQSLFILYGLILTIGYTYVGLKIRRNCVASQSGEDMNAIMQLVRISFISAGAAALICVTHLYSAVSVFGIYSDAQFVESWSWWTLQSCMRVEEIIPGIIILKVASRSIKGSYLARIRKHIPCNILNSTRKKSHSRIQPINVKHVTEMTSSCETRPPIRSIDKEIQSTIGNSTTSSTHR